MKTDILVIGTGTSGYIVANSLKKAGKSVVIADKRSFGCEIWAYCKGVKVNSLGLSDT